MKPTNLEIDEIHDDEVFHSNSQTVSHNPDKFILDFKSAFPQFSINNQMKIVINHRIIVLDLFIAKDFHKTLGENIKKYEGKFGKIEMPEAVKKTKKEFDEFNSKEVNETPSYVG